MSFSIGFIITTKYFLKTDGFIHKTAMSNNCYYLFFHFTNEELEYWITCQNHTQQIWCRHKKKNLTVLICVFIFNLQSRHCDGMWSIPFIVMERHTLQLSTQELLTKTQADSPFTIFVRIPPSCQQLFNFPLSIWQCKTGFFCSGLLQGAIQAYCWIEVQFLQAIRESALLP